MTIRQFDHDLTIAFAGLREKLRFFNWYWQSTFYTLQVAGLLREIAESRNFLVGANYSCQLPVPLPVASGLLREIAAARSFVVDNFRLIVSTLFGINHHPSNAIIFPSLWDFSLCFDKVPAVRQRSERGWEPTRTKFYDIAFSVVS